MASCSVHTRRWDNQAFALPTGILEDRIAKRAKFRLNGNRFRSFLRGRYRFTKLKLSQTLERVKVDMTKIFEKGQAYVALSRATSQSGLQITGLMSRRSWPTKE